MLKFLIPTNIGDITIIIPNHFKLFIMRFVLIRKSVLARKDEEIRELGNRVIELQTALDAKKPRRGKDGKFVSKKAN